MNWETENDMKERKPEILYSDPVKEIMGNPPRRILRWGTGVMFSVFVLFIIFAWLIRYPDTIPAPVEITTSNPPVTLVTKKLKSLAVGDLGGISRCRPPGPQDPAVRGTAGGSVVYLRACASRIEEEEPPDARGNVHGARGGFRAGAGGIV